jgi:hypothetical protein
MDIIKEVLDSTATFEAPRRFYYWATLAAISAVLKDKVWFNMADNYNNYSNIYVLLYGSSGIRKGPAIDLARDLVSRVNNTRVIDGRSSIEAVIKELGTSITKPGESIKKDACGFLVASELSSSIVSNPSAMDILTDLFDRKYNYKEWKYRLKNAESAALLKPTITWLAATNEALFKEFVPEKNLKGGLIGRMFLIHETEENTVNSLMFKTRAPDREKLTIQLKEISRIAGEFKMGDDVRHPLDLWYNKFKKEVIPALKDETGFASRTLDFVITVSMIISSGRRGDREIKMDDVQEALDVILPLIAPTKKIVNSFKREDDSYITKKGLVLTYITEQPEFKAERSKLLRSLGLKIKAAELDQVVEDFIAAETVYIDHSGGKVVYKLKTDRKEVLDWIHEYRGSGNGHKQLV